MLSVASSYIDIPAAKKPKTGVMEIAADISGSQNPTVVFVLNLSPTVSSICLCEIYF